MRNGVWLQRSQILVAKQIEIILLSPAKGEIQEKRKVKNEKRKKLKMIHSPKYSEIYSRATKYCAAQERCVKQVSNKLFEWKVGSDDADQIIDQLQKENYINEERFVKEYAISKFHINKWGRIKIANELRRFMLSEENIWLGTQEINSEEYMDTLTKLLATKSRGIKEKNKYLAQRKVANFAISKGFEAGLVWETIRDMKK